MKKTPKLVNPETCKTGKQDKQENVKNLPTKETREKVILETMEFMRTTKCGYQGKQDNLRNQLNKQNTCRPEIQSRELRKQKQQQKKNYQRNREPFEEKTSVNKRIQRLGKLIMQTLEHIQDFKNLEAQKDYDKQIRRTKVPDQDEAWRVGSSENQK